MYHLHQILKKRTLISRMLLNATPNHSCQKYSYNTFNNGITTGEK